MGPELVIAALDQAGGHAAIVGMLFLVVVVAGLVYGLVQLVKSRAEGPPTDRSTDRDREAQR
jgi:hypothetical protein